MNEALDKLRIAAEHLDMRHGGMASVYVFWHPYRCEWCAKADWSSNHKIDAFADTPEEAVEVLMKKLGEL